MSRRLELAKKSILTKSRVDHQIDINDFIYLYRHSEFIVNPRNEMIDPPKLTKLHNWPNYPNA